MSDVKDDTIIFLDSTIQVARTIREKNMKARISTWLSKYKLKTTGLIVLLEFKRRVLRDLAYLLVKLNKIGSYQDTLDYITNVLPPQQNRKRNICLPLLHAILPGASDDELTERARIYFRTLLVYGEKQFLNDMDSVIPTMECYWARFSIREKKRYVDYDVGGKFCSKSNKKCQIGISLQTKLEICKNLLLFLQALPSERLTDELKSAREFLDRIVNGNSLQNIHAEEVCLNFGDLLIALESEGMPDFYTINYRESQAYCDFLEQKLVLRPKNPAHDEKIYDQQSKPWPAL